MKNLILVFLICTMAIVTGCAHNFTLIPRQGGERGQGVAQEMGKSVTITLNGKTYSGTYVYSGGSVAYSNTFGTSTAYSGTKTATAFGSGFGTTYIPGSGNGRVLAISPDGDAIRCEFMYSSRSGLGICQDNAGKEYDLLIDN